MEQEKTTEETKPEVLQELKRLELELGEVRASVNGLDAEIDDAINRFVSVKERVVRLMAEKAELSRSLDETRGRREEFAADARKAEIELRGKLADAERVADRWRVALDAALNDVDVYRRAAEWCGAAAIAAIAVAVVVF
ncbi:MAG: hypothetical protein J6K20_00380 [Thermoguttaceae bacterium]|nr:hypothetical protein [Thermoguttaceae bacterium]